MVSPTVIDTSDATFETDVIARSAELPVIVDFWAPWCGPCRVLSPTLEALAAEYDGKVQVVKLNTDDNPQTAGGFGISGIPAVIAFQDGKPVSQFVGALPEEQVREFFENLQPSQGSLKVREAALMLREGQTGAARLHLEAALEEDPDEKDAAIMLAAVLFETGEAERAVELAERFPNEPEAKQILGLMAFKTHALDVDRSELEARIAADESDAEAHYRLGCLLATEGDWSNALDHLLLTVRLDRELDDDGGRLRMLDAFSVLGDGHELAQSYRRQLGQVLF